VADPLAFAEANVILYPPDGQQDDVIPLHVRRLDGALVSCWQLTAAEREEVARTGVIWLVVEGRRSQPAVALTAIKAEVI
jgi:hypothetical protein